MGKEMTYHQIVDKIVKTFDSCENLEQVSTAYEYCYRLIDKEVDGEYGMKFASCEIDSTREELIWFVDKKRLDVYSRLDPDSDEYYEAKGVHEATNMFKNQRR